MPADDIPPSTAGLEALDRRWRVWAAAGVATLAIIAVILGFFVLPEKGEDGVSGALGVAHHAPQAAALVATAAPPTGVAWTQEVLRRLTTAPAQETAAEKAPEPAPAAQC